MRPVPDDPTAVLAAALLSARDLRCERDGRVLFEHLDLAVGRGDVLELRGPNGSGKTTLLRCLAGLTEDFTGTVAREAPFLYLGHRGGLNRELTVLENLRWYAALEGFDADIDAVRRALADVGLDGYALTTCQHLSAGQQRRVTLARLVLGRATLWLLDEPFTALDESGCGLVRNLLDAHRGRGGGAVCATHPVLEIEGARRATLGPA
jgi:heme exporter protein A